MANWADEVAQAISGLLARRLPPANTRRIRRHIRSLQTVVDRFYPEEEGNEMSTPTPDRTPDMRSIDQNDINDWATNIGNAVTALQGLLSQGTLAAADETVINTALGNLDGVAGVSVVTPPAPVDTPPPASA